MNCFWTVGNVRLLNVNLKEKQMKHTVLKQWPTQVQYDFFLLTWFNTCLKSESCVFPHCVFIAQLIYACCRRTLLLSCGCMCACVCVLRVFAALWFSIGALREIAGSWLALLWACMRDSFKYRWGSLVTRSSSILLADAESYSCWQLVDALLIAEECGSRVGLLSHRCISWFCLSE